MEYVKVGRLVRYRRESVEKFLQSRTIGADQGGTHTPDKVKAARGGAAQKSNRSGYYRNGTNDQGKSLRLVLSEPAAVLQKLGLIPVGKNSAGYLLLKCPFHKNGQEQHPSLNLHSVTGHYRCHACGTKGGDVLAFYMAVTGKSFKDTRRELGVRRVCV